MLKDKSEIIRVYLSHDQDTQDDDKVVRLFYEFRKLVKTLERNELEALAGLSGYTIFWSILEYMHRNSFTVNDIDLLADKLRIKSEFVKMVLDNFSFFRLEQDKYISDRMLRDIAKTKDRSKTNQSAVAVRWLIFAYSKAYEKEFGIEPVLSQPDKNALIKYSNQIKDFKQLLPKILKKLHKIKFKTDIGFQGRSNWLLKDDNLAQIVNGQYGDIVRAEQPPAELAPAEQVPAEQVLAEQVPEDTVNLDNISSKAGAIKIIHEHTGLKNIRFLTPEYKALAKKFDISQKEYDRANK